MPYQAPPARTQRESHRDLPATRGIPGKKKIGQVCASDEQNDQGDSEKDKERVGKLLLQLAQTLAARKQLHMARSRDALVVIADPGRQLLDFRFMNMAIEHVQAGFGLSNGNAWFATRKHLHPSVARILQAICRERPEDRHHHHRHADVSDLGKISAVKAGRCNADDSRRSIV